MTAKPTTAQMKTLRTIIANGGEMNGYAGQPGFYCNSLTAMVRKGFLEDVEPCATCTANYKDGADKVCDRPLYGKSGVQRCYGRVRITDAGRIAAGEEPVCGDDAEVATGSTVQMVKPRGPHEVADAVIVDVQDHKHPLEGGGTLPTQLYQLQWPDGGATWHLRHEFQPILDREPARLKEGP